MTKDEAKRMMALLKALYPRQTVEPETIRAYAGFIVDLDAREVEQAINEHVAESPYFPTVADIRQRVAKRSVHCPGADEAWGEVLREVRRVGYYGRPQFSHPAIAAAVDALGWQEFCQSDVESQGTWRAHFNRYYEAGKERAVKSANVGRLEEHQAMRAITGDVTKRLQVAPVDRKRLAAGDDDA